ncbi:MAG: hypothetical protein V1872_06495 [bacterium]
MKSQSWSSIVNNMMNQAIQKDGFTLIELAIVCFLLGLFFLISLPMLENNLPTTGLNASARNLSGMIRQANSQAALKHTKVRLNYDFSSGEYWLTYKDKEEKYVEDKSVLGRRKRLTRGVKYKDIMTYHIGKIIEGQTYTEFAPNGLVEKTVIHLANKEDIVTLSIKPLTGNVAIYNEYLEGDFKPEGTLR